MTVRTKSPGENPGGRKGRFGLTKREQAAVLRLYLRQRFTPFRTAKQLRLDPKQVRGFLGARGVLRTRGNQGVPTKLTVRGRQRLVDELPTTMDFVLAPKYGISRERVRQIRREMGYVSSRVLLRRQMAQARAGREEQKRRAVELRRQRRRAKRLRAVNRLSKRWKDGLTVSQLSREFGVGRDYMQTRIVRLRKEFPAKFPLRQRHRPSRRSGRLRGKR